MMFQWFAHAHPDQFLYHYTRAATLLDHILPNLKLRFSRFGQTNDPLENQELGLSFSYSPESAPSAEDLRDFNERAAEYLRHRVRILCCTADPHPVIPDMGEFDRGF